VKLTRQQAFDRAVTGVIKQGAFAYSDDRSQCFYRYDPSVTLDDPFNDQYPEEAHYASAPVRCAIGQLIDDANYSPDLEGLVGWSASVLAALGLTDTSPNSTLGNFLGELQSVHDTVARAGGTIEDFKRGAREFAEAKGLGTAVLDA
jgi:hypothetical protein